MGQTEPSHYVLSLIVDPDLDECKDARYQNYTKPKEGFQGEPYEYSKQWFREVVGGITTPWQPVGEDDKIIVGGAPDCPLGVKDRVTICIAVPSCIQVVSITNVVVVALDPTYQNPQEAIATPFCEDGVWRTMIIRNEPVSTFNGSGPHVYKLDLGPIHQDSKCKGKEIQFRFLVATDVHCLNRKGEEVHLTVGHDPVMRVDEGG